MPISRLIEIPTVSGVGANQQATVEIPPGRYTYEKFGLELGGTTFTKAQAKNIALELAGKPIQQFKNGTQLDLLNAYYGRNVATNELVLHQFRPEFLDAAQARLLNLGMSDVSVCQLRLDIDAAAVAPTLAAYARRYQFRGADKKETHQKNSLGALTKIKRFVKAPTGAGDFEIDDIPKEGFIQALHFITTSDNINSVEVEADGVKVWDASTSRMERDVENYGRTKQSSCYHVDFMLSNEMGGAIPMQGLADFRCKLDMAGADNIDLYVEYLSGFSGI